MTNKQDYHLLKPEIPETVADNLSFSKTGTAKVRIDFLIFPTFSGQMNRMYKRNIIA
jgi:hypothetical protein